MDCGYANSIFYPETFLYIPAIFKLIGISTMTSYKIFICIVTFFTFITMYITSNKIFKNRTISMLTTILYTLSLYRFTDIYIRGAVGEILSFTFLPLVLYGIYDILYCNGKKWWVFLLGIWGLSNSHMISLFMAIVMILVLILINIKKIFTDKKLVLKLVILGCISILIVLCTVLPILEQLKNADYKLSKAGGDGTTLEWLAITPTQALKSELVFGWAASESSNMDDVMTLGIGIILYILPVLLMFQKIENKKDKKIIAIFLILGILSAILTTKIFPWKYCDIIKSIQYPWRFNLLATLFLSLVSAYSVYNYFKDDKKNIMIVALIIIIIATLQLNNTDINIVSGDYSYTINWAPIANGEYLPQNFDENSEYNTKVIDISNNIEFNYRKEKNKLIIEYDSYNQDVKLNVPLIYYRGYEAKVITEENIENLKVEKGENGLIQLEVNKGFDGEIVIEYKMTTIQKVGYTTITSIWIISIIVIVIEKIKKYK